MSLGFRTSFLSGINNITAVFKIGKRTDSSDMVTHSLSVKNYTIAHDGVSIPSHSEVAFSPNAL